MQKETKIVNIDSFILILADLHATSDWEATVENRLLHLRRKGSDTIFSPLTAVYFHLSGKEIHRGSFWVEELTNEFGMLWWEILEISYAWIACDCGHRFSRHLRKKLYVALNLPLDRDCKEPAS